MVVPPNVEEALIKSLKRRWRCWKGAWNAHLLACKLHFLAPFRLAIIRLTDLIRASLTALHRTLYSTNWKSVMESAENRLPG